MRLSLSVGVVLLIASCGRPAAPSLNAEFLQARSLLYSERYEQALAKAQTALHEAERTGATSDVWRFRCLQLDVLLGQRRIEDASQLLSRYGGGPAGSEWAEVRGRLKLARGRVLYAQNKLPEAAQAFQQAAVLAAEAKSQSLGLEVALREGLLLIREQKLDEARARFEALAETAAQLQDRYLRAIAMGNVGFVLQRQRRYEEAVPWFEHTVSLFTSLDAPESVARNEGNLATCYWGLGDYENAQVHYRITEAGFAKTGNRDSQQIWLGNAANVRYELGDYAGAERGYSRALEIARAVGNRPRAGLWLANLAATAVELGKWDAAAAYNADAARTLRAVGDPEWNLLLAVNAGRIEEGRGRDALAQQLFRSALNVPGEDAAAKLDAHAGLARLAIRQRQMGEADAEFREAVSMIETSRKSLVRDEYRVSYLASLIRFYRQYVEFLIATDQKEKALEIADSSRARLLEERSGGTGGDKRFGASDYRRVARQMHASLFEYLLGPEKSYLWVIEASGVRLNVLPGLNQIRPLLESYRAVVTGGRNPLDGASATGRRLFEMLLAPGVKGAGRFVIVPDQDLYSFNLETLPKPGSPGKYWIEEATVAIAPSLNYLAGRPVTNGAFGRGALLAIGDAAGTSAQYPKLQFAGQEITDISSRVGTTESMLLRGESATPAAYADARPGKFGYIHFAAHAAANQQSPLDSAVVLSGPSGKNRLLAREVMTIPLTAELVTISACRSAGGKTYAGEGLVGFAWAFLRAGARNVIAGLWDVSDRSTAQLMAGLYGEIAKGTAAPEALREAKLQLIRGGGAYAKPFYWAPFQVYAGRAE